MDEAVLDQGQCGSKWLPLSACTVYARELTNVDGSDMTELSVTSIG